MHLDHCSRSVKRLVSIARQLVLYRVEPVVACLLRLDLDMEEYSEWARL